MPPLQSTSRHHVSLGGVGKTELLRQLRETGVQLNPLALQLFSLSAFETSTELNRVAVEVVSVKDLGLSEGGTFGDITVTAEKHGLLLCPLELGPHLRLAYRNQEEGSIGKAPTKNCAPPGSVTIASAPVSTDEDLPRGFYLRVIEGTLWLRGYRSWPGHISSPQDHFAFVVRSGAA
jgi:hypothetical protein